MNTDPGNVFERRFQNRLEALGRVTEEALQFIAEHGVGGRAAYAAHLALEELASNIIKYGYDDTAAHEILLRLEVQPGALLLLLEDDGHEFNPLTAPEPDLNVPTEERAPGGLGLHLVRKLVDELDYQRSGAQNRVKVRIRL